MNLRALLTILLLVASSSWAQDALEGARPLEERTGVPDGIVGIVVNQTVSPMGYEFYRTFTDLWYEKTEAEKNALSILERPSKRYGNHVWVYLGQQRVFAGVLPIKRDKIRELCERAVGEISANIVTLSLLAQGTGDPDIARPEL